MGRPSRKKGGGGLFEKGGDKFSLQTMSLSGVKINKDIVTTKPYLSRRARL